MRLKLFIFIFINFIRDNAVLGKFEERALLTGVHVVCDVYCRGCNHIFYNIKLFNLGHKVIGWKYVFL